MSHGVKYRYKICKIESENTMKSINRRHNRKIFYKYTSAETAKTILINKSLRFSSPLILNDPFDVVREIKLPFNEDDFNKGIALEIARLIEEDVNIQAIHKPVMRELLSYVKSNRTDVEIKEFAEELRSSGNDDKITQLESFRKEFERDWNELLPKSRILSLSEINDNPAMWAHYADKYRGVVL